MRKYKNSINAVLCARERTRTSTSLRTAAPQAVASANFATRAILSRATDFLADFLLGEFSQKIKFCPMNFFRRTQNFHLKNVRRINGINFLHPYSGNTGPDSKSRAGFLAVFSAKDYSLKSAEFILDRHSSARFYLF